MKKIIIASILALISILSAQDFSPVDLHPSLWLDAGDQSSIVELNGHVSQWNDKSGKGHHVVQDTLGHQPTYSTNSITFDGVDDFLLGDNTLIYGADTTLTLFIVATPDSGASKGSVIAKGEWTSGNDYRIELGETGYDICLQGARVWNFSSADWSVAHVNMIHTSFSKDKEVTYSYNGTETELPKRDVEYSPNSSPFSVGGRFVNSNNFRGKINEIILFSKDLTAEEKVLVEGYLAHKWAILPYLPNNHIFKNSDYAVSPNQTFIVAENSASETVIGAVTGVALSGSKVFENWVIEKEYPINGTFKLSSDGQLSVLSQENLNYENATAHSIEVSATVGAEKVHGVITVNITDVADGDVAKKFSVLWGESGEKWDSRGRLPDFSFVGVHSGESPYSYGNDSVNILDYGGIGTDSLSDYKALVDAINAIDSGIVYIPAGLYVIDSVVEINKGNIVIRGAGDDSITGTRIYMPNSASDLNIGGNVSTGDEGAILRFVGVNGGYRTNIVENSYMGDRSITVDDPSRFTVGDIIDIQFSGTHPVEGELWNHILNNQNSEWPCSVAWSNGNSGLSMYHTIERISGNIITVREPIRLDLLVKWSPQIQLRTKDYLYNCGIEDLFIKHRYIPQPTHLSEPGFNSIELNRTFHSWVKNVTIKNADNAVLIKASGFGEIKSVTLCGRGGHHGTSFNYSSHCLMDSLNYQNDSNWIHSFTLTHKSNGNVVSNITGNGKVISTDFHRNTPWETLITNVDQPWNYNSSGVWCAGPNAGKRTVYWNMGGDGFTSYPNWDDYQTTLVGDMHIPEKFTPEQGWHENVPNISPKNLWEAQLNHRTSLTPSPKFGDGSLGSRSNWFERDPSRWEVLSSMGNPLYSLNFSKRSPLSGGRPGEYSIFDSSITDSAIFSVSIWSPENSAINLDPDVVLIADYQDDENYLFARISRNEDSTGFYRVDSGTVILLSKLNFSLSAEKERYSLEKNGGKIQLYKEGVKIGSTVSSPYLDGKFGVGSMDDAVIFSEPSLGKDMMVAIFEKTTHKEYNEFSIFPNPAREQTSLITLEIPTNIRGMGVVGIYDAVGNLVYQSQVALSGTNRLTWNLKNSNGDRVAGGSYLLIMTVTSRSGETQMFRGLIGVKE